MELLFYIILLIAVIALGKKIKRKLDEVLSDDTTEMRGNTSKKTAKIATGCANGVCQYQNPVKAREAGYPEDTYYCRKYDSYVKRRETCPDFYKFGCKTGMCVNADFHKAKNAGYDDHTCFCSHYNEYVKTTPSCRYYDDEENVAILRSLAEKISKESK